MILYQILTIGDQVDALLLPFSMTLPAFALARQYEVPLFCCLYNHFIHHEQNVPFPLFWPQRDLPDCGILTFLLAQRLLKRGHVILRLLDSRNFDVIDSFTAQGANLPDIEWQ